MANQAASLPPPLVKFKQHPTKWLSNKLQLLAAAVVLAYVGMLIIVAIYYLVFQVNPTMNQLWHNTISNADLRHKIRNVAEGMLGGFLAQQVIWNHFKQRGPKNRLDQLEEALHISNPKDDKHLSGWQVLATPELALIYAIPGFLVGAAIASLARHNMAHVHQVAASLQPAAHTQAASIWAKVQSTWVQNWDQKLMGYGASYFFGRRPARGVFDDVQLWFAERRVALGKPPEWYHLPTFKARYNDVLQRGLSVTEHHGPLETILMRATVTVGLLLAIGGWYVLNYIAA